MKYTTELIPKLNQQGL